MYPRIISWSRTTQAKIRKTFTIPESTAYRAVIVVLLMLGVSVATFIADSYGLRVVAAAYVIPAVATVHFWGLKKAVPVLIAVPVLNEFVSFTRNWTEDTTPFADANFGGHIVGSLIVVAIAIAYSSALKTSRSLKQELKLREVSEVRESLRATRQSILAKMSREIGSIENPERMRNQVASAMHQLASPDSVILYERVDQLDAWVEVAQSGPLVSTPADSIPHTLPFDETAGIDEMVMPTWSSLELAESIVSRLQGSSENSGRVLIVPILWRARTLAFAALTYITASEPDDRQTYLLQQATWQIAGSLAGSLVYRDAVNLGFRLEREATARDRMTAIVSHEMRTPLTAAVAMNDVLLRNRDNNLSERQTDQLRVIRRNLQRIVSVSDDLLESSRMRAGTFELQAAPTDLVQLVKDAVDSFRPVAEGLGQEIRLDLIEEAITVVADSDRMSQVVINLLGNASKFSPHGSVIHVQLSSGGTSVRIEVIDRGSGINSDEIADVFNWAFQSEHRQSTGKHGAGIGLWVSKAIVDAHGGTIGIDSVPGEKTTAWFEVPVIPATQPTASADSLEPIRA